MNKALAPRHLQLRDILLRRWKTIGLKVGDRIESQNEIVQLCEFSLITVVKTLKDLESEGVIWREVGKGSFLKKAPWAESWYRIGFIYNRDVVGGGIFRNAFYTELVMAFERQVVSDGHSFSMTSIANSGTRLSEIDALDIAVITAISSETQLDFIDKATSQVVLIDQVIDHPKVHCFRAGFSAAMRQMAAHCSGRPVVFLYLDTLIESTERQPRLEGAREAMAAAHPESRLEVFALDPEKDDAAARARLLDFMKARSVDVVFGHVPRDLLPAIAEQGARAFPFSAVDEGPALWLDPAAWMADVLPRIYANFEDRQLPAQVHEFSAVFRPCCKPEGQDHV